MSFVPLLVITLMTPPAARPTSAEYPLDDTWNSCTASWLKLYGLRPVPARPVDCPKNTLLASEPSTVRLLAVPRWPPKLRSPPRDGSRTTPGVSTAKSRKLRPLIGRLEIDL